MQGLRKIFSCRPDTILRRLSAAVTLLTIISTTAAIAAGQSQAAGGGAPMPRPDGAGMQVKSMRSAASGVQTEAPQDYLISAEDLLDIYIVDVPELSRQYRVSPSGLLSIPLLPDPVKVEGLTPDELANRLAADLRSHGLVSNAHVSITVKESRAHSVAIAGAVKKPQIYYVFGRSNLLDILSLAGGLEENAGSIVRVTRGPLAAQALAKSNASADTTNEQQSLVIDLRRLLETGDPALNVSIFPGDSVTVPLGGVVYVVGAVNKPGGFTLSTQRQGITVMQVLALAEDIKSTAQREKAVLVRRGTEYAGGREEIAVNLKKILAGKAPDLPLQANDILYVPDSFSRRAWRRGAEAAIQAIIGVAIYHP
jgi:polysaccharide biosynthesis/export protein